MGLAELVLLAVGLSMDAFAVSICKGVTRSNFSGAASILGRLTRSVLYGDPAYFYYVSPYGDDRVVDATNASPVSPAWCF